MGEEKPCVCVCVCVCKSVIYHHRPSMPRFACSLSTASFRRRRPTAAAGSSLLRLGFPPSPLHDDDDKINGSLTQTSNGQPLQHSTSLLRSSPASSSLSCTTSPQVTKKSVRFREEEVEAENDNSANEGLEHIVTASVNNNVSISDDMVEEPLYATVRKRTSPCKELHQHQQQWRHHQHHRPQVPLNIQPELYSAREKESSAGVLLHHSSGFRPYTAQQKYRHVRQNTDLWINSYKVNTVNIKIS